MAGALGDYAGGIVDGGAEGAFFSDDSYEVPEHVAVSDVFLVAGVEGFEEVVGAIVGEFFDGDGVFF